MGKSTCARRRYHPSVSSSSGYGSILSPSSVTPPPDHRMSETQSTIGNSDGASWFAIFRNGGRIPEFSSRSYLLQVRYVCGVNCRSMNGKMGHPPIEELADDFCPAPPFLVYICLFRWVEVDHTCEFPEDEGPVIIYPWFCRQCTSSIE